MSDQDVSTARIDALYKKLDSEAESAGYHLNPDADFTKVLVESLLVYSIFVLLQSVAECASSCRFSTNIWLLPDICNKDIIIIVYPRIHIISFLRAFPGYLL